MPLKVLMPVGAMVGALLTAPAVASAADEPRPRHSSDRVVGEIAPPRSSAMLDSRRLPATTRLGPSHRVGPGIRMNRVRRTDARGPVVGTLLTVKWGNPRVRLDYLNPGQVARTATVSSMLAASPRAVAGINGDFFDIGDTGAPFGLGKFAAGTPLHAPTQIVSAAFHLGRGRAPLLADLQLTARVKEHPEWVVTDVNSPSVDPDGIGVYTRAWGRTVGTRITDGQKSRIRVVHIRGGRVVKVANRLSKRPIEGKVLVGRSAGADQLRVLRVGDRVTVGWRLPVTAKMAISGNKILLSDGVIQTDDDVEMHPRTSIGIDEHRGAVLMFVADGRQRPRSRGLTMLELAETMVQLGAEHALNLDGGGSSTLVAKVNGRLRARNRPSDGRERKVANGIQVRVLPRR